MSRRIHAHRRRLVVWAIGFLTAFAFGAAVRVALADHYHTYNGYTHGLVHGESTTDGSYFGRILFYTLGTDYYCAVGDNSGGGIYFDLVVRNDTCSVWSRRSFRAYQDECAGFGSPGAWDYYQGRWLLSVHQHTAHQPPRPSCRVYNA